MFKPSTIAIKSVVGRVVAPAETNQFGVTTLRLAVGQGYKDKQSGDWKETETAWLDVTAVNEYGELLKNFGKGDLVEVEDAKLEVRTYDKKDGSKGFELSLKYGTVVLLEAKGENQNSGNGFTPETAAGGF